MIKLLFLVLLFVPGSIPLLFMYIGIRLMFSAFMNYCKEYHDRS